VEGNEKVAHLVETKGLVEIVVMFVKLVMTTDETFD